MQTCNSSPTQGYFADAKGACQPCPLGCQACNRGGQCSSCLPPAGLVGTRCVDCTQPHMRLDARGRCKCADGWAWSEDKVQCVEDTYAQDPKAPTTDDAATDSEATEETASTGYVA